MSTGSQSELQRLLRLGNDVVVEQRSYPAKSWVTCVSAADIDGDGDIEIVASSRDGRLHVLTRYGELRWTRMVGEKKGVDTFAHMPANLVTEACLIAGTRDGRIYAFDKEGRFVDRAGKVYPSDGEASKPAEWEACWHQGNQIIRQLCITPDAHPFIIAGSEDRNVYAISPEDQEQDWQYPTGGWVRTVVAGDIDNDGIVEILAGCTDNTLYVLTPDQRLKYTYRVDDPICSLAIADINHDGQAEILIGTDNKDLLALTADCSRLIWHKIGIFADRILSLHIIDLDQDGNPEIIAGSEDKSLYILNQDGNLIWRYPLGYRALSVFAYQVDTKGTVEVVVGSDGERIHFLHVALDKGLDKKIRRAHHIAKTNKQLPEIMARLNPRQMTLLKQLLNEKEEPFITVDEADNLYDEHRYREALVAFLRLRRQKVQINWSIPLWLNKAASRLQFICALTLCDLAGDKKPKILVGTANGELLAFNSDTGKLYGKHQLQGQILSIQSSQPSNLKSVGAEVVVCSTDHNVYIVGLHNEHTGKRNSHQLQTKSVKQIDDWISSVYVKSPGQRNQEIIFGSEDNKIYIYDRDMQSSQPFIATEQGIKIVNATPGNTEHAPEIIAGSLENKVYAYRRDGTELWQYSTRDRIRTITTQDINSHTQAEIVIGSEDRNVHVLNSQGQLRWRYYLPHMVLATDSIDVDNDGVAEVLAGCADGYLYVFNNKGDLLWKYNAHERIRAVLCRLSPTKTNTVEIILATASRIETLELINQQYVDQRINDCWKELCKQQNVSALTAELLYVQDVYICAFAIEHSMDKMGQTPSDFTRIAHFIKSDASEVRQALIQTIINNYAIEPQEARELLNQLWKVADQETRIFMLEHFHRLIMQDWSAGIDYLQRFIGNPDRLVRRAIVRQLHLLVENLDAQQCKDVFALLLIAIQDKDSEWVCQEAASTLAHFLERKPHKLYIYIVQLLNAHISLGILTRMEQHATPNSAVHDVLSVLVLVEKSKLTAKNAQDNLTHIVPALEKARQYEYGTDTWQVYEELRRLFSMHTIEDISQYRCTLNDHERLPKNDHIVAAISSFKHISRLTHILRIYGNRDGANDRLTRLQDALGLISKIESAITSNYQQPLLGKPMMLMPDYTFFTLLLKYWSELLQESINELRGQPKLELEVLSTQHTYEPDIVVALKVTNSGSSTARYIHAILFQQQNFQVSGPPNANERESIFPKEETVFEFNVHPQGYQAQLLLHFEVSYYDLEQEHKKETLNVDIKMQLPQSGGSFDTFINPYSMGTPIQDSKMFYGRRQDIAILRQELLMSSSQRVIVLHGQRRAGKTTLLFHLAHSNILHPHIPVMIDLHKLVMNLTSGKLFFRIADEISKALSSRNIACALPTEIEFESYPSYVFDRFLEETRRQTSGRAIVLLLDEFETLEDQIAQGRLDKDILHYLRSLMQDRPGINFLLSGTHKLQELTEDYWSILFHLADHYKLSKLDEQSAEALIQEPVEGRLKYDPFAVNKLRKLTGDQPYLINVMCHNLVNYCLEKGKTNIAIRDINVVQQQAMQTGTVHFNWLWKQLTSSERELLQVMAQERSDTERYFDLAEIEEICRRQRIRLQREELSRIIKTLINQKDVLESITSAENLIEGIRYKIPIGLFRIWIKEEHPLIQSQMERFV